MPIVIKWEGAEILCDTPEEAVAIARGLKTDKPIVQPRRMTATPMELLRLFHGKHNSILDAEGMAGVLETTPNGVGTKLRHMRDSYRETGFDLDQIVRPQRQSDGTMKWEIQLVP